MIDVPNKYGFSPLMTACSHGDVALVELLLTSGANVEFQNENGYSRCVYGRGCGCGCVGMDGCGGVGVDGCFCVYSVYVSTSKYIIPLYFHSPLSVRLERFYCIEFQRSNFLQLYSHFYQSINQSIII